MKNSIWIATLVLLVAQLSATAQSTYTVDPAASKLLWLAKKVTGEHNGTVNIGSGSFTIDAKGNLSACSFEVDMTSLKNLDMAESEYGAKLDGHLKSEDFFSVEKHPKATFTLAKKAAIAKGNALVKGKMTIKGITQPVEFKAVFQEKDGVMNVFANFSLDRTKFDIRYGSGSFFDNLGDKTIYDDFQITLNLVNKKQ